MRFQKLTACAVLIVLMLCGLVATAADDIQIDVVDGHFISGDHDIPMANVSKPISLGAVNGEVVVRIQTAFGEVELNLGKGRVAVTQRASDYVTLQMPSTPQAQQPAQQSLQGDCPQCGSPLAQGDHRKLPCGHYACQEEPGHPRICTSCRKYMCNKVDHTKCPGCGVGACRHDDKKCTYRHNPVPKPFSTKNAEGKTVYYYVDPSGVYFIGANGTPWVWSPAKSFPIGTPPKTPTPSPTP